MVSTSTRSRATVSQITSASSPWRSTSTTVPPPASAASAANSPVPCISGAAGKSVAARFPARAAAHGSGGSGTRGMRRHPERDVEVVVAPHDTLGHPGRAAGVEEDQVVTAGWSRRPLAGRGCRQCLLVGTTRLEPHRPAGRLELHDRRVHRDRELGPVHDRLGVGVVEEVAELARGVAEVDVHGHRAEQQRGVERLEVLGAVGEIDGHAITGSDVGGGLEVGAPGGWRDPRNPAHGMRRSPHTSASRSGTIAAMPSHTAAKFQSDMRRC